MERATSWQHSKKNLPFAGPPWSSGSQNPLPSEWWTLLQSEFEQPYMRDLAEFLLAEECSGKVIYPPHRDLFAALKATTPANVRIVILGQDPYHGQGQAHGLAFSVQRGQPIPPSLRNIYKELAADLDVVMPAHGCLSTWAEQGVLLLNTVLSVESSKPGSHQGKGWETFTDKIIYTMSADPAPKVFMLWGAHAGRKSAMIASDKHLILTAPHPSPLSAHRGFLGCGHFSAANRFLEERGRGAILWELPD